MIASIHFWPTSDWLLSAQVRCHNTGVVEIEVSVPMLFPVSQPCLVAGRVSCYNLQRSACLQGLIVYYIRTDISKADRQLVLSCALEASQALRKTREGNGKAESFAESMCQFNIVCMTQLSPVVGHLGHYSKLENITGYIIIRNACFA